MKNRTKGLLAIAAVITSNTLFAQLGLGVTNATNANAKVNTTAINNAASKAAAASAQAANKATAATQSALNKTVSASQAAATQASSKAVQASNATLNTTAQTHVSSQAIQHNTSASGSADVQGQNGLRATAGNVHSGVNEVRGDMKNTLNTTGENIKTTEAK